MIDIRDLSIGCWVQHPEHGIGRVIKLGEVIIGVCFRDRSRNIVAEALDGIPLTPELMKQLGWFKDGERSTKLCYYHPDTKGVNRRKNLDHTPLIINLTPTFKVSFCAYDIRKIQYLHELQQFYRWDIPGQHLEIKL